MEDRTEPPSIPPAVLDAYALRGATIRPIHTGWINRTLAVSRGGEQFVLQRLHHVFRGDVNRDIDVITRHLAAAGLPTTRIVPTVHGDLWVDADGAWRLLTFMEGETRAELDVARARSAGALAGRFHRALGTLSHEFTFTRPGAHDTNAHLARLREVSQHGNHDLDVASLARIEPLAEAILTYPRPPMPSLPQRIVHGDLKATNLLFEGERAMSVIDLDTIAHGSIAIDMGDALRSWCNCAGESSAAASFDRGRCEAALTGYVGSVRGWVEPDEVRAIISATETIALELASRFATDVYEDSYFGFDSSRYRTRRAHNLDRVGAQLALARSVAAQRQALDAFVETLLRD